MGENNDSCKSVLLVIINEGHVSGDEYSCVEHDVRKMNCGQWNRLITQSYELDEIRIRVDTQLLSECSAYFKGLLNFENFGESGREIVKVDWNLPIFCMLLGCIHDCDDSWFCPPIFASLIQAATYYGVEKVNTMCENRLGEIFSHTLPKWRDYGELSDLCSIWMSATDYGVKSIVGLCVKTLAINFAWVMRSSGMREESFIKIPLALLEASVSHPELTVNSEMDLCNALLHWYENQAVVQDSSFLFKKIQLDLLPIDFILRKLVGKYQLKMFQITSTTSSDSDDSILSTFSDLRVAPALGRVNFSNFKPVIRVTDYLEELDLSCCPQITINHLIAAAVQVPTLPKNKTQLFRTSIGIQSWPDFPILQNLRTVNLSHCWRIELASLLQWLKLVGSNLLELRAPHCGQSLHAMLELASSLSDLEVLDLSELEEGTDIVGAATQDHLTSERSDSMLVISEGFFGGDPGARLKFGQSLRELSLRGRSELTDMFLQSIGKNCPQLRKVNFDGCSGPSEDGFMRFLGFYESRSAHLQEFSAAATRFGPRSCKSFTKPESLLPHVLNSLDLCKCSALSFEDLRSVLQALPLLVSLALAFTNLNDIALSAFSGTSLERLNVRETKVSGRVLSEVLAKNRNLQDLNIRGCTQVALYPLDYFLIQKSLKWVSLEVGWGIPSSVDEFSMFGILCELENLAIGVGGTVSGHSLLRISEDCTRLKRLSLSFQTISDEDLIGAIRNMKSLQTLELQNMTCTSRNLLKEIASSIPNLKMLRLERVVPWLTDDDLSVFSQSFTGLQSLSLLGCHQLTNISISTMVDAWRGLQDLRLEECRHILTQDDVGLLLGSFKALRVLHLRHIGKVLHEDFIVAASTQLPMLQKLAIDRCDSTTSRFLFLKDKKFPTLKCLYINQCQKSKDFIQGVTFESPNNYKGRIHKDTTILHWNLGHMYESVVPERRTFE